MDLINALWNSFLSLSTGQKLAAVLTFLAVAGGLAYMAGPLKHGDYSLLYAKLSSEDAAQIVDKLKNEGVPYAISNGGRTIKVPSDLVYDLRLKMSMEGLPRGQGSGLELFDKSRLGVSDFAEQVNFQRALQGELGRTISTLDAVEDAKVHIVFPEESPFLDAQERATASVVVKLRGGAVLEKKQIQGMVYLVAGAVKGLKPADISILDAAGGLLSGGKKPQGVYAQGDEFLELQREVEEYLEGKAKGLLEELLGPGKSVLRIAAALDPQMVKQQTETFEGTGVLRSEQTVAQNGAATPSSVKNYEVGKTVKEIMGSPGVIKKLSVSLAIDGIYKEEGGKKTYVPRTPEEIQTITQLVKQAVGFSEDREDQMEVRNLAFDRNHEEEMAKKRDEMDKAAQKDTFMRTAVDVGTKGARLGSMVLVAFLFFKFMKGFQTAPAPVQTQGLPLPPEAAQLSSPAAAPGVSASAPPAALAAPDSAMVRRLPMGSMEADLVRAAKQNPADLARLMHRQYMTKTN